MHPQLEAARLRVDVPRQILRGCSVAAPALARLALLAAAGGLLLRGETRIRNRRLRRLRIRVPSNAPGRTSTDGRVIVASLENGAILHHGRGEVDRVGASGLRRVGQGFFAGRCKQASRSVQRVCAGRCKWPDAVGANRLRRPVQSGFGESVVCLC